MTTSSWSNSSAPIHQRAIRARHLHRVTFNGCAGRSSDRSTTAQYVRIGPPRYRPTARPPPGAHPLPSKPTWGRPPPTRRTLRYWCAETVRRCMAAGSVAPGHRVVNPTSPTPAGSRRRVDHGPCGMTKAAFPRETAACTITHKGTGVSLERLARQLPTGGPFHVWS